jgi:predicted transcriptional regulator of viral defense system
VAPRTPIKPRTPPTWDDLYRLAEGQSGYFTRTDAASCGFSAPLLHHHVAAGAIQRARRGVYRLTRFPPSEHEDLVVFWLWTKKLGVLSHETALTLHALSDALPARAHLTVPASWRRRRITIPDGVVLHFAEVAKSERTWFQAIPITTVARTIHDLLEDAADPGLVRQAISQAKRRGLLGSDVVRKLAAAAAARARTTKSK